MAGGQTLLKKVWLQLTMTQKFSGPELVLSCPELGNNPLNTGKLRPVGRCAKGNGVLLGTRGMEQAVSTSRGLWQGGHQAQARGVRSLRDRACWIHS